MPFITEELWHALEPRKEGSTIMYEHTPEAKAYDKAFIDAFELAKEAAGSVRSVRQQKGISPKEPMKLVIKGDFPVELLPVVKKLANVSDVDFKENFNNLSGVGFMVGTIEMFVLLEGLVNAEEEIAKLEAALEYQKKFLDSVRKKLSNANFTAHAPEAVVAGERKKEADSLSKIASYESQLKQLKNNL